MKGSGWNGLLLTLLISLVLVGMAQGARITDKLLAGLYPDPDSTGKPTRVLPSDTPLERLEKRGDFTRVRLGDGSEGWVESRFITDEKPARIMLLELQAKNSQLQQQLRDAERQLKALGKEQPAGNGSGDDPELNALKRQLADAQAENALLKNERPTDNGAGNDSEALAQRIVELEQQLAETVSSEVELTRESSALETAQQVNRQLEQRLQQIARLAGAMETTTATEEPSSGFKAWELPLLLLAMLFSFIGGVAFKNYRLAKRYGGFRI